MYTPEKVITYKGCTIELFPDDSSEDPRTMWDNMGTLALYHQRYTLLGDRNVPPLEEVKKIVARSDVLSLPVFMLDHSGITFSTTSFNDPWDSGQVGWIYVTKEKVKEMWGKKIVSKDLKERVLRSLQHEVAVYDAYHTGNVVGYIAKDGDKVIDECWGFFPETLVAHPFGYVVYQAQVEIDTYLKHKEDAKAKREFLEGTTKVKDGRINRIAFSRAVEIVLELARGNIIEDPELLEERDLQVEACAVVEDWIVNNLRGD